ncbi:hypothetical protein BRC90_01535 [Halobacteriales archaeon QS_4_69_34]|nr:MAG: hypothetical protein BRC90_01535 [Halobacteriales archaeon QS_4_69_34]
MNLDELRSARSRERQTDSLQHLSESFYADVGAFIAELRAERERAAAAADDPFDAPEVRRLSDDIETAEATVEALYERRVGKLVKQASLAAAGMATDDDGLTAEEGDLTAALVEAIEDNRRRVLDDVLAEADSTAPADDAGTETAGGAAVGEPAVDGTAGVVDDPSPTSKPATADTTEPATDSTPSDGTEPADGVNARPGESTAGSAADAMGPGGAPAGDPLRDGGSATAAADTADAPTGAAEATEAADAGSADGGAPAGDTADHGNATARGTGADDTDRTTVRITQDVGEILGVDERTYELSAEDVVTLPAVNATPLLDRDAAEQL